MAGLMWSATNSNGIKSVFVQLTLTSPNLAIGNVVEMSVSFPNPARVDYYDIALSQVTYESDLKIQSTPYIVQDLVANKILPFSVLGTTASSYSSMLDTANKGASDWNVSRQANDCSAATYCTWQVEINRPLLTLDTANDTQLIPGSFTWSAGWKVYQTSGTTNKTVQKGQASGYQTFKL